jgi:hypothetical protein
VSCIALALRQVNYFPKRRGEPKEATTLNVSFSIDTEPEVQIKELYGHLTITNAGNLLYETELAEKPDVSFVDGCAVFLQIPYDDNNPLHRKLRFAKDEELNLVFSVTKVVLADGHVKTFGQ